MKQKEKAIELINKFRQFVGTSKNFEGEDVNNYLVSKHVAQKAALIAVDLIIESSPSLPILSDNGSFSSDIEENKKYWLQVKTEIEKQMFPKNK